MFDRIEALWQAKDWDALVDLETKFWVDGPVAPAGRAPASVRERVRQMIHAIETRDEQEAEELPPPVAAVDQLERIACPVLVVVGAHDTTGTRASADLLTAGAPVVQRVDFPDAAHLPSLEHPERFNAELRKFLDQRES